MSHINHYVNFNQDIEDAFIFYQSVFGGEFANIMRLKNYHVMGSLYKKMKPVNNAHKPYI